MKITRKYKYRRNLPHIEKNDRAHFVTFVTADRWLLPEEAREIVLRSCLHDHEKKLFVHVIVVMPGHVHMIFEPLRDAEGYVFTLAEILNPIKGVSAHGINKLLGRRGNVWQDESFDHVLRSDEKLAVKIEYVRVNPVRRGLVTRPSDYRWLWAE